MRGDRARDGRFGSTVQSGRGLRHYKSAVTHHAVRARRVGGKFFATGVCQSRRGGGWVRPHLWRGSTRANVCCLHARTGSHGPANAGAGRGVSSDQNRGLFGAARRVFQAPFTAVIENEFNRRRQAFQTFFSGLSLPIRFRHLRAEGNEPLAIPLDDGRVVVSHASNLRHAAWTDNRKNVSPVGTYRVAGGVEYCAPAQLWKAPRPFCSSEWRLRPEDVRHSLVYGFAAF